MKRSVLFLTTEWPTEEAPVTGIFVREFAHAAAEIADVSVVHMQRAPSPRGLHDVVAFDDGVPVRRVRYRRFGKPLSMLAFVLGARAAIRATGRTFDVVHAHSILAAMLARVVLPRTPLVYTEQWSVFLPDSPYELRPAMRPLAKLALRSAWVVLPPSRAMRDALARIAPRATFHVVPNVVDTSLFARGDASSNGDVAQIVSVGMMPPSHVKGFDFLLDAARLLTDGGRRFTLQLAGDGPMRAAYEARVRELGLGESVRFHGVLSKPELSELLRCSDLFVLASRFDNNPCVVIEAMASGLPVVATRVGGVPEMVEPESGILVAPQDPQALAEGIADALERSFDARHIAERAAERYGRAQVARQLADVYDKAAARR
jgi:glycosyltransferase involved in cell wall biosynthesis